MKTTTIRFHNEAHFNLMKCFLYIHLKIHVNPQMQGRDIVSKLLEHQTLDLRSVVPFVLKIFRPKDYHFEHPDSVPEEDTTIIYDIYQSTTDGPITMRITDKEFNHKLDTYLKKYSEDVNVLY